MLIRNYLNFQDAVWVIGEKYDLFNQYYIYNINEKLQFTRVYRIIRPSSIPTFELNDGLTEKEVHDYNELTKLIALEFGYNQEFYI